MHLPEETQGYGNSTTDGIVSAFSWESRDTRADDLPMMNSIVWALGEYFENKVVFGQWCLRHKSISAVNYIIWFISGVALMHALVGDFGFVQCPFCSKRCTALTKGFRSQV